MMSTLVAPPVRDFAGARSMSLRPKGRLHDLRRRGAGDETATVPVVLIDDDAMARSWLRLSLRDSEFTVEHEATTAEQALALIESRPGPWLLLVDHRLPDASGVELLRDLRTRDIEVAAVLLATTAEPGLNEAARDAGAQGTLLKTGSRSELLEALRSVELGESAFDSRHPRRHPICSKLTPREREVLSLVAEGATNGEIASVLGIGIETVKTLLRRSFAKLGVQRRVQAVWAARELGIV
jgi:DNA-binding NarL/FixJ family response regulator